MDKGKAKKDKNYLSILFVPHFSGKVKAFRISSFYTKLSILLLLIMTVVVCTALLIASTINENNELKNKVAELCDSNIQQKNLISARADEIKQLKANKENIDDIIDDFIEKYKEMTNNYISNRIQSNIASRSGDRSERSFAKDIVELRNILKSLNQINNSKDENLVDLTEVESKLKAYLDAIPTLWPSQGRLTDEFGYRIHPIYRRRIFHEGIDIGAQHGSNILAAGSGKVVFSGRRGGYGLLVIIDHGYGITTRYGHASKILVKEGDTVQKGDVIAKVGNTGTSTGAHLHFEVRLNGTPVDPLQYLDSR